MTEYDPLQAPDAAEWLATDESERIGLILDFHRRARVKAPSIRTHAIVHAAVETQVAMGAEIPVAATLTRLLVEGLDRHDAIHAIGSVLVKHMRDIMVAEGAEPDPNRAYWKELERLSANTWRHAR
ncbi:MAG: hypothetical protein ABIK65_02985 [Candidatus Eisenbacteria bacterium]